VIAKEARAARWAVIVGLLALVLRLQSAATTNLKTQTMLTLIGNFDADFSAVSSGHVSAGAAFLWATFFNDLTLYLLAGLGGVILGSGLIASETSSGSIYVLLSRPLSRTQIFLTKYAVAAGLSLLLCALYGCMALAVGAWQGIAAPPFGGWMLSALLLWLGMLFVVGLAVLYGTVVSSAFASGVMAFFTAYLLAIVPVAHSTTGGHIRYYLGGPGWSIVQYFGSLGIYAGVDSPVKSLVVSVIAALIPLALGLALFVRKAF
jgi:ABC-2 type transport system permease protein